jgi:putative oxidoreductase
MAKAFIDESLTVLNRWGQLLAYLLLACIFIWSGWGKLMNPHATAAVMSAAGIPLSGLLVFAAIAVEIGGGAALALGFKRSMAALLLSLFLLAATLSFHNFWRFAGPEQPGQFVQFLKNMAILGGLLFVALAERDWRPAWTISFVCRLLVALIFFMNAFGIVNQERAAHELALAGAPERLAPLFIRAGQVTQAVAGILLLFSKRLIVVVGALLLAGFLVPATLIAHRFWTATPDIYAAQLTNFLKNAAMIGSLLVIAAWYAKVERAPSAGPDAAT